MNKEDNRLECPICSILTDKELGKKKRYYIDIEWQAPEDMIDHFQKHTNKEILVYIAWELSEKEIYSRLTEDKSSRAVRNAIGKR